MSRMRGVLAAAVIGVAGLMGVAACGSAVNAGEPRSAAVAADEEAMVLASMGFDVAEAPGPGDPSPKEGQKGRKRAGHGPLGKNLLHSEAVVQTKDGTRTVVAQRGSVTAVDDRSVTVKSADGFSLTWTFGNPIRVVERRTTVQPNAIKVGTEIGVVGTRDGAASTANRIVIGTR